MTWYFSAAVSFWSGVSVVSVAALMAEVEDMQEKHCDHSVRHSINLIKKSDCTAATTHTQLMKPRLNYHQSANGANHTVTTQGVWVISAPGSHIKSTRWPY